ncbi:MAG: type 1 glutamine amidotransferase domain-containing protein [Actinomycetota bacterium]|nr:type 1 glutamine amidotransferase domain-containing protein [Actinomycetota bacterium]
MNARLADTKVAFLATDGVEQVELTQPWQAVKDAGGTPELVSVEAGTIRGYHHLDPADPFDVDRTVADARAEDYVGLVLPGGVANPDQLRMNDEAVAFVQAFVERGRPVAAICHAPWLLIEAGVVSGRTITSYPSVRTDLRNAGATVVDEQVVVCDERPSTFVTSRNPDDLDAFCSTFVERFAKQLTKA